MGCTLDYMCSDHQSVRTCPPEGESSIFKEEGSGPERGEMDKRLQLQT